MNAFRLSITVCLFLFTATLFAQRTERVHAEYTYHAPENVTLEAAKRTALERAKIQAIADEFGTTVSQTNTTFITNRNGESNTDFQSLGGSEVKGEWIETIGEPEYSINYEQGMLVVAVKVNGRIREITTAQIDFKAEVLCNGTDLKFARTDFRSGDDLYLYFQSPVDGYLAVYLLDDAAQMVYCLLPYKSSSEAVSSVEHDKPYIFFSAKHAGDKGHLVDEYTMTCAQPQEQNTIYVIFSPNEFAKANSQNVDELLPQELSFEDFQKWLAKGRNRDWKMTIKTMGILIKE